MPTIINGTDDTAATPALTGADTDTGVFFPAANTMAFSTGGTEKMRVESSGNLNFTSTGQRITGDFSDVTPANRVAFQTSTTNGNTQVEIIPNGTGTSTGLFLESDSTITNSSALGLSLVGGTDARIQSLSRGGGTFLPMTFYTGGAERLRIDTSGNLLFDSGYGSVATAYGCRAWVNFDGSANTNLTGTYSQTGTTVTVTITAHGYTSGQIAYLDFTSGTAVDGAYTVTVTDANTFTVTQASRTTSGNVTSRRNTIRASGNVSSITDIGTGEYRVNFTTAMPDTNYSVSGCAQSTNGGFTAHVYGVASSASELTTTGFPIATTSNAGTSADSSLITVAVFR